MRTHERGMPVKDIYTCGSASRIFDLELGTLEQLSHTADQLERRPNFLQMFAGQVWYGERACSRMRWRGAPKVAGVYALFDPADPAWRVRYVGSSDNIEARLYHHVHDLSQAVPRTLWARELRACGRAPAAALLQGGDFGERRSAERHAAEAQWIDHFHARGEADLNVQLTPAGHANSTYSRRSHIHAELRSLRARVAELEAMLNRGNT